MKQAFRAALIGLAIVAAGALPCLAQAAKPAASVVVLDAQSPWRTFEALKPPVIEFDDGLKPVVSTYAWLELVTPAPASDWTKADFGDANWLRGAGPHVLPHALPGEPLLAGEVRGDRPRAGEGPQGHRILLRRRDHLRERPGDRPREPAKGCSRPRRPRPELRRQRLRVGQRQSAVLEHERQEGAGRPASGRWRTWPFRPPPSARASTCWRSRSFARPTTSCWPRRGTSPRTTRSGGRAAPTTSTGSRASFAA